MRINNALYAKLLLKLKEKKQSKQNCNIGDEIHKDTDVISDLLFDLYSNLGFVFKEHAEKYFNMYVKPNNPKGAFRTVFIDKNHVSLSYTENKVHKLVIIDKYKFINLQL